MAIECPNCEKLFSKRTCPTCGWEPQKTRQGEGSTQCWIDGERLLPDGRCASNGGYIVPKDGSPLLCPFVCPICRGRLDWDGGCMQCYGCTTGRREDWTFPGDRYEAVNGHRVKDPESPAGRRACTPEENRAGMRQVLAILSKSPIMTKVKEG